MGLKAVQRRRKQISWLLTFVEANSSDLIWHIFIAHFFWCQTLCEVCTEDERMIRCGPGSPRVCSKRGHAPKSLWCPLYPVKRGGGFHCGGLECRGCHSEGGSLRKQWYRAKSGKAGRDGRGVSVVPEAARSCQPGVPALHRVCLHRWTDRPAVSVHLYRASWGRLHVALTQLMFAVWI